MRNFNLNVTASPFNADPMGRQASSQSFNEAIEHLKSKLGGGTLLIPSGTYKIDHTIIIPEGISIKGAGPQDSVVLDFSGQRQGSGMFISNFGQVHLQGFVLKNPKGNGIEINTSNPKKEFRNFCYFQDIRVENAGLDGFYINNAWMLTFERCWSRGAKRYGFNFEGFQTSINLTNCYASGEVDENGVCLFENEGGFNIQNTVYSSLLSCGADGNRNYGYFLSNCQGISINGCGAEGNYYSSIGIAASDAWASNLPEGQREARGNVSGITIQSFFSLKGNVSCDKNFGEFITINSENRKLIQGASYNHSFIQNNSGIDQVIKRASKKKNIQFPIFQGGDIVG